MKGFNETEIKYLAGLLDADGSLSFSKVDGKLYMEMQLSASDSVDKQGYVKTCAERCGYFSRRVYTNGWSPANQWRISKRSELNMLLPRIMKHMVIKGRHWAWMFDMYNKLKGQSVEDIWEVIKESCDESRLNVGPIRHKNHPTWAWTAGYLDGDGSYSLKKRTDTKGTSYQSHIMVVAHRDDIVGLELLNKAFGGYIYEDASCNCFRWKRNLGKRDRAFAKAFLSKLVNHSRLKKWKIEQILAFHN